MPATLVTTPAVPARPDLDMLAVDPHASIGRLPEDVVPTSSFCGFCGIVKERANASLARRSASWSVFFISR
jgi:hypothetical protein